MRSVLDRLRAPESPARRLDALSLASGEVVVYALTAGLLFGGLFLAAVGTVWVVQQVLGLAFAVVGAGATMTAYGLFLVVVLNQAGYLDPDA